MAHICGIYGTYMWHIWHILKYWIWGIYGAYMGHACILYANERFTYMGHALHIYGWRYSPIYVFPIYMAYMGQVTLITNMPHIGGIYAPYMGHICPIYVCGIYICMPHIWGIYAPYMGHICHIHATNTLRIMRADEYGNDELEMNRSVILASLSHFMNTSPPDHVVLFFYHLWRYKIYNYSNSKQTNYY
jgi:hypothetical protein